MIFPANLHSCHKALSTGWGDGQGDSGFDGFPQDVTKPYQRAGVTDASSLPRSGKRSRSHKALSTGWSDGPRSSWLRKGCSGRHKALSTGWSDGPRDSRLVVRGRKVTKPYQRAGVTDASSSDGGDSRSGCHKALSTGWSDGPGEYRRDRTECRRHKALSTGWSDGQP